MTWNCYSPVRSPWALIGVSSRISYAQRDSLWEKEEAMMKACISVVMAYNSSWNRRPVESYPGKHLPKVHEPASTEQSLSLFLHACSFSLQWSLASSLELLVNPYEHSFLQGSYMQLTAVASLQKELHMFNLTLLFYFQYTYWKLVFWINISWRMIAYPMGFKQLKIINAFHCFYNY